MLEPGAADGSLRVLDLDEPPIGRDERSMAWLEYLVSLTALAAALLLAITH